MKFSFLIRLGFFSISSISIATASMIPLSIVILVRPVHAGEAEVARFQEEFPRASRFLEKRFSQMRGGFQYSEQIEPSKNQFRVSEVEFSIDNSNRKSITTFPKGFDQQKWKEVICVNSNYTFLLERKWDKADYLLKSVNRGKNSSISFDGGYGRFLKSPYCLVGSPMAEIIQSKNYRVVLANSVQVDNRDLVEVALEFGGTTRYSAKVLFDPAIGWAIRKSEVILADMNNVKISTIVDYDNNSDKIPVTTRVVCTDIDSKQKICNFHSCDFKPTPASEFEPTFFGLPDLGTEESSRSRQNTALWLGGLALCGLIISYIIKKMATRNKSQ